MTPSNPSNSQPLIYRIMDALGVTHLVACINHTHEQSEVEGLQAALLNKADAATTDTKINGKISRVPTATNGNIAEFDDDGNIKDSGKKTSDFMPAMTIDDTPTENSDNLVTSGGVKAALDGKQGTLTFDTTPTAGSNNPVTSGGVKAALDVQKRINNRQLQLTKTADGYQFVNSESDLPTFVNMIKSWGGKEDYVCANCIVITDGDAVAMPAMFNWAETSSYIIIRAYIGCYLLEGDIRKNGSSYSSDMMMQLEDRSYVFSE